MLNSNFSSHLVLTVEHGLDNRFLARFHNSENELVAILRVESVKWSEADIVVSGWCTGVNRICLVKGQIIMDSSISRYPRPDIVAAYSLSASAEMGIGFALTAREADNKSKDSTYFLYSYIDANEGFEKFEFSLLRHCDLMPSGDLMLPNQRSQQGFQNVMPIVDWGMDNDFMASFRDANNNFMAVLRIENVKYIENDIIVSGWGWQRGGLNINLVKDGIEIKADAISYYPRQDVVEAYSLFEPTFDVGFALRLVNVTGGVYFLRWSVQLDDGRRGFCDFPLVFKDEMVGVGLSIKVPDNQSGSVFDPVVERDKDGLFVTRLYHSESNKINALLRIESVWRVGSKIIISGWGLNTKNVLLYNNGVELSGSIFNYSRSDLAAAYSSSEFELRFGFKLVVDVAGIVIDEEKYSILWRVVSDGFVREFFLPIAFLTLKKGDECLYETSSEKNIGYEHVFKINYNDECKKINFNPIVIRREDGNKAYAIIYDDVGKIMAGLRLESVDVNSSKINVSGWCLGGGSIVLLYNNNRVPFVLEFYPRTDVAMVFLLPELDMEIGLKLTAKNLGSGDYVLRWFSGFEGHHEYYDFPLISNERGTNDRILYEMSIIGQAPWFFDEGYYIFNHPPLRMVLASPLEHYLRYGWKENRNPSHFFNTKLYLQEYEDVRKAGVNPLVHFIESGWDEERKCVLDDVFMKQEADLILLNNRFLIEKIKVAIVWHLFYEDLFDSIVDYIKNMPFDWDIYVTTRVDLVKIIQYSLVEAFPDKMIVINGVENKGRDMAPFFIQYSGVFKRYDFVCKIHGKKSKHDANLCGWGDHLLNNLLGSEDIIKTILGHFLSDATVGVIYPVPTFFIKVVVKKNSCWGRNGDNFMIAKDICDKLGIKTSPHDEFSFPVGSMFWFRPSAIQPLFDLDLKLENFCEENGQIDGTLAHALERLIGLVAEKQGFSLKSVYFSWMDPI